MANRYFICALALVFSIGFIGCSSSPEKADSGGEVVAEDGGDGLSDEPMGDEETVADEGGASSEANKSLFERMGGKAKFDTFASKLVDNLASNQDLQKNPNIAQAFSADQTRNKQLVADFFCAKAGGPCSYGGPSMKDAFSPMKVSASDWKTFRVAFIRTLKQMHVPKKERMELALIAAHQKKQIVTQ